MKLRVLPSAISVSLLFAYFSETVYSEPILPNNLRASIDHSTYYDDMRLSESIKNSSKWNIRLKYKNSLENSLLLYDEQQFIKLDSSLRGTIAISLQNSDALRAQLHQTNSNYFLSEAARFALLPTISFQVEKFRVFGSPVISNNELNTRTSVSANWTIFSSGARWASIKSADYTTISSDFNYLVSERQTLLQNLGNYMQLGVNMRIVSAIQNTLKRLKRLRRTTNKQYKAGIASLTDIAQIDAEISSIKSQLIATKQTKEEFKIVFKDVVGKEPPNKVQMPKVVHLVPDDKKVAVTRALNNNYAIAAASASYNAALSNKDVIRGQSLPQVDIFANASTNNFQESTFGDNETWEVGARLTIPLVNLQNLSSYKQATEQALSAKYLAQDINRQIKRQAEINWTRYHALTKQENAIKRQKAAIKRSIIGITKQVQIGLRSIEDLLREEIQLTSIEISRIQLEAAKIMSAYRLAIQISEYNLEDLTKI